MANREEPGAGWSSLSQSVQRAPYPMVYGRSSTVDAYCELELHERGVAQQTLNLHTAEATLWYIGLRLLRDPFFGEWEFPEQADDGGIKRKAHSLQAEILGLEISSAKCGIDLLLEGHYSIALAAVRHMLEAFIQIDYLSHYPEKADVWYTAGSETPNCRPMIDQIKKSLRGIHGEEADLSRYETLYQAWRLMSKGSHPTGSGITQVQPTVDDPRHILGPNYRPDLAKVVFDNGLFAFDLLLECVHLLGRSDAQWVKDFAAWQQQLYRLRDEMLNQPSTGQNIGSAAGAES